MRERGGEADQGEGGVKTSQIALQPPSPRLDAVRRTEMHLEELSLTLRAAAHLPPDDGALKKLSSGVRQILSRGTKIFAFNIFRETLTVS